MKLTHSQFSFCFGFVLYHPPVCFWNTLTTLLNARYTVFIADNSTDSNHREYIDVEYRQYLSTGQLVYRLNSSNLGLSHSIKLLIQSASIVFSDFLIYLDQDTCLNGDPTNLFSILENIGKPLINYSVIYFSPFKINKAQKIYISVNSGTAFNVKDFSRLGLIPDFFLEMIDFGISLNLRVANLESIVVDASSVLVHDNKDQSILTNYFLQGTCIRVYSLKRLYNIIINSIRILFDSVRFKDSDFFIFVLLYLVKVCAMQLSARFLLMVESFLAFVLSINSKHL